MIVSVRRSGAGSVRRLAAFFGGALLAVSCGPAAAQDTNPAPTVQSTPPGAAEAPRNDTPAPAAADQAQAVPGAADQTAAATPAQTNPDGCFVPPAKLPLGDVEAFLARPAGIYDLYGITTFGLANRVRALAGSDPRTLGPILELAATATDDQKAAIGSGLGRAAFVCAKVNAVYAQEIQSRVADFDNPQLLAAFVTASNDVQVAAISGNGGGAAASGLSGGGIAGPGSAGLGGDEVVPTTFQTYRFAGQSVILLDDDDDGSDDDDLSPATPLP